MSCKSTMDVYNEFIIEVVKLQGEIESTRNGIHLGFGTVFYIQEIDKLDVDEQISFDEWRNKKLCELYNLVESHGLYLHERENVWYILPFDVKRLSYEYDNKLDILIDILTGGQLRHDESTYSPLSELTFQI